MLSGWSSQLSLPKESADESGATAEADDSQQQGRPPSHVHGGEQSPALEEELYGFSDDVIPFPEVRSVLMSSTTIAPSEPWSDGMP